MSNSALVNYRKISPNRTSPRRNKIDRITIHHMAGNLSVEACGDVFAPKSREASSNYGIGSDGRVGLYVEEKDRAWTSGSGANDHRAVTIEVADNVIGGNWGSSAKAMAKLILLCADICRRNGIKRLNYTGNTKGNLTLHKWFQKTDCPGRYLESQMPTIASEVNKLLASGATSYTWKGATASSSAITSAKTTAVDGSWGIDCTYKSQKVFGTTADGIVSYQPQVNKKYLPNCYTGSWQFYKSGYSAGSQLIKAIQKMLKSAGYYAGAIDGWCGKGTVTAIQKMLKAKGLYSDSIDGSMGPNTVKGWQKYINSRV